MTTSDTTTLYREMHRWWSCFFLSLVLSGAWVPR